MIEIYRANQMLPDETHEYRAQPAAYFQHRADACRLAKMICSPAVNPGHLLPDSLVLPIRVYGTLEEYWHEQREATLERALAKLTPEEREVLLAEAIRLKPE